MAGRLEGENNPIATHDAARIWRSRTGVMATIKVLSGWEEVGEACTALVDAGLPLHTTPQKNWDLWCIARALWELPRSTRILDVGCSGLNTLRLLVHMGFHEPVGVDLKIHRLDYYSCLKSRFRSHRFRPSYHLIKGDFADMSETRRFGVVVCVSVIEHGMQAESFFARAARLCSPEGMLLITTDYWPTPISTSDIPREKTFGLPWTIFSPERLREWLACAEQHGFRVPQLDCGEHAPRKVSRWHGRDYTTVFLQLDFD